MKKLLFIIMALLFVFVLVGCARPADETWTDVQVKILDVEEDFSGRFSYTKVIFELPDGNKLASDDMEGSISYRDYLQEGDSVTLQHSNYNQWRYKDYQK